MYNNFQLSFKYLYHYLTASSSKGHGIHSPFVFNFITKILNDKKQYPEYEIVEGMRKRLLKDHSEITVDDAGAGSAIDRHHQRTVSSLARHSVKSKKYGQLLFRMVKEHKPATIVEMGTSLGVTSAYLALANTVSNVITMEGAEAIAQTASENFKQLNIPNIRLIQGNFDQILSSAISPLSSVNLAFIDGNHRQEPTERYFRELLSKSVNDAIFIIDDIHWSREMEKAWENIRQHPSVRCSIDLFFMGIVFFRQEFKNRQHFKIRY